MFTYTITLTGVFDAETPEDALAEFRDWASQPGCVEQAAVIQRAEPIT